MNEMLSSHPWFMRIFRLETHKAWAAISGCDVVGICHLLRLRLLRDNRDQFRSRSNSFQCDDRMHSLSICLSFEKQSYEIQATHERTPLKNVQKFLAHKYWLNGIHIFKHNDIKVALSTMIMECGLDCSTQENVGISILYITMWSESQKVKKQKKIDENVFGIDLYASYCSFLSFLNRFLSFSHTLARSVFFHS